MGKNEVILYKEGELEIEVQIDPKSNTVWLSQQQMAELFSIDRTIIVRHIANIYKDQELDKISTCAKNAQIQIEGKRKVERNIPIYNLDMIISVGYRVKSKRGIVFRLMVGESQLIEKETMVTMIMNFLDTNE